MDYHFNLELKVKLDIFTPVKALHIKLIHLNSQEENNR